MTPEMQLAIPLKLVFMSPNPSSALPAPLRERSEFTDMNLSRMLRARAAAGDPIRVGVIGAGKFGSMYLAQAIRTPGVHVLGVADLDVERARAALDRTHWTPEQYGAASFDAARRTGATHVTADSAALIAAGVDVIVEATGNPAVGIRHALAAFQAGAHVAMVNVEADALAGPLLAREAAAAGVVYSLAYGDQPALIVELVDWARTAGFEVIAAGKGTRYQPYLHQSTPATVWDHYGIDALHARQNHLNAQMFNSFLDGTKSALEMAAVANACSLNAPADGLAFPDLAIPELPDGLKPKADGGLLEGRGMVEVVASERRNGDPIEANLRWGVYVTFAGDTDYARTCFKEYGIVTDASGNYSAMWRPAHLIGLELGLTVASAALRKEPTGVAEAWRADVVAVAKTDLVAGVKLDGEGGYTVWGKLMPAKASLALGGLPIGLAHGLTLKRAIPAGAPVSWSDVATISDDFATSYRKRMEREFAPG